MSYRDAKFGYRLWDLIKKKLIKSRDVVFHEQEFLTDIGTLEKPIDNSFFPGAISVSLLAKSAIDRGVLYEKFRIDNELTFGNNDDIDIEGIEQKKQPPLTHITKCQVKRSTKEFHPSTRYPSSNYTLFIDKKEPKGFLKV